MGREAKIHLGFFYKALRRVLKPGRVAVVHVCQIPNMKRTGGQGGLHDFRGINIAIGKRAGLIYDYDWMVRKNPQALKNGTSVLTPDSWVRIEDLRVGDMVIGADGSPTKVKGVYHHEPRQMYRVGFSDGTSVECDGRHLWQVSTRNGPQLTMTTDEIREYGTHSGNGDPRFRIPIMSHPAMLESGETLPIDPYTLGVILGDGSVCSRGSVTLTTEHEIVASAGVPAGHSWRRLANSDKGGGAVASYISNGSGGRKNEIVSGIRELGLDGLRAWEKFVPHRYLFSSAWNRLEILRGLMDTDGTIKTRSGVVCKFCSTSEQLARDVMFLAQSLGGVARIGTEDNSQYVYKGERKTGRRKYLVSLRMPDGLCPFKVERKASRWSTTRKSVCRWIKSIEPTEVHSCTCIEVDSKDHLYVTENCIVTHNSQAIRSRSRELQFAGLESDRSKQRGTLNDYLIKFVAPGENERAIDQPGEVSRDDWIKWAEGCWDDIQETDTLNVKEGRGEDDTKHICPLQLEVIRRLVLLFSLPDEIVFSPFTGIGSEGFMSLGGKSPKTKKGIALPRRFYGCELKPEYYAAAQKNLERAVKMRQSKVENTLPMGFDE